MTSFRIFVLVLISVLPGGCLHSVPNNENSIQTAFVGPFDYLQDDLRAITLYAGYIAGLSTIERVTECNRLIRGEAGSVTSVPVRLHTALIMMLTPECGGPQKALLIFESINDRVLQKELRSLVRYQIALANWLIRRSEQSEFLEKQIGTLETNTEILKQELKTKDTELDQLKATLDALKEIEKTFHQRNESGVP
jgi:hypothetical protein